LPPAPRTEMLRQSRFGDLPVIGPNNAIPWRVYARPFEGDASLPRVGVIITGLGQRSEPTEAAIGGMPPDVTLAFDPYARDLAVWMGRARQGGHETLLELPVEGRSFPAEDPGPLALMSMLPEIENKRRLEVVMSRAGGYVGLLATEGGQFTDNPALMRPILQDMKTRGLMYVHQGAANAVNTNGDVLPAVASVTLPLDSEPFTRAVDERLSYVESVARAQGFAVIITEATPLTLYRLSRWLDTLPEKGLVLAPASALVLSPSG
ncbi:MAG: divergent polysaccharide deacetylase family protein, partial [Rhodospirillaceae bacterium]